ncbi:MAG: hypothetical protein AB7T10_06295 [bacterium]
MEKMTKKLRAFLDTNHSVKNLKKISIALLCNCDNNFSDGFLTFISMKQQNKEIIDAFKENHYNIIAGSDEHLKKLSPLEVFFIHRTDIIIAFDGDDLFLHDEYRSAFNSPVYFLDTESEENLYSVDRKMRYSVNDVTKLERDAAFENLYRFRGKERIIYFISEDTKRSRKFIVEGLPVLNKERILMFNTNYKTHYAVHRDLLGREINLRIRGLVNARIVEREDGLLVKADIYREENEVKNSVRRYLNDFIKRRNIEEREVIFEFKTV